MPHWIPRRKVEDLVPGDIFLHEFSLNMVAFLACSQLSSLANLIPGCSVFPSHFTASSLFLKTHQLFLKNCKKIHSVPSNGPAKILTVPVNPSQHELVGCILGHFQDNSCVSGGIHILSVDLWQDFLVLPQITLWYSQTSPSARTFMVPATVQSDAPDLQLTGLENTFLEVPQRASKVKTPALLLLQSCYS